MIVDIHPHIVSTDESRYPVSPIGAKQSKWSLDRPASAEDLLKEMDSCGVDKAVIVHASTVYGFDNSYVADVVAAHPQRFAGVFSVNTRAGVAREMMKAWSSLPGMVGLRIFTAGSTLLGQAFQVDDPSTYPAWRAAAELGHPVCMQVTAAALPELEALMLKFPSVPVILDHFGKPDLNGGIASGALEPLFKLSDYDNLFLKFTPRVVALALSGGASPSEVLRVVTEHFGAARIAWGSNFPNAEGSLSEIYAKCYEALSELQKNDIDLIMGGTALSLYPTLNSRN